MKRIWAPWRMPYIRGEKVQDCVFCQALSANDDADNLVLWRDAKTAVMLNRYPYVNGHLLVLPYAHVGDLSDLDDHALAEMMLSTKKGIRLLRAAFRPHGFNVGVNMGEAAGAGIQDHVHIHIVPRWHNDTNFMPVLGDVRVIPQSLEETYRELLGALRRMVEEEAKTEQ